MPASSPELAVGSAQCGAVAPRSEKEQLGSDEEEEEEELVLSGWVPVGH